MVTPVELALLALANLWIAWRYSAQPIGPDEADCLMWGMTGSKPYWDHPEPWPPGLYLWFWALAHLFDRDLRLIKFFHHMCIGAIILAVTAITGSIGTGLMATALLQGARLFAFQSWFDSIHGALLLLAFVLPPEIGVWVVGLAVACNLKAALPGAVFLALSGAWWPLAWGVGFGLAVLLLAWLFYPAFDLLWYNLIELAGRLRKSRPWALNADFTFDALTTALPALGICLLSSAQLPLIGAALATTVLTLSGKVWRPNHFMPLAFLALARPDPLLALLILLTDALSARLYLGNVWGSVYPSAASPLAAAKIVGEGLRNKAGKLWVNTWHAEVYVYAQKPPAGGLVEYIEFGHELLPEIAIRRDAELMVHPPEWVVQGELGQKWRPTGYVVKAHIGDLFLLGAP